MSESRGFGMLMDIYLPFLLIESFLSDMCIHSGRWLEVIQPGQGAPVANSSTRTLLIYSGVFTFLVDAYPLYAASALAANLFARCSFAGS